SPIHRTSVADELRSWNTCGGPPAIAVMVSCCGTVPGVPTNAMRSLAGDQMWFPTSPLFGAIDCSVPEARFSSQTRLAPSRFETNEIHVRSGDTLGFVSLLAHVATRVAG